MNADKFSASRAAYEEAAHRNNWYMCKSKHITTLSYIMGVRKGEIFCLKYENVRKKSMYTPPSAHVLFQELQKECKDRNLNLGIPSTSKPPAKDWMIDVLSTLNPDHLFFDKNYKP